MNNPLILIVQQPAAANHIPIDFHVHQPAAVLLYKYSYVAAKLTNNVVIGLICRLADV